MRSTLVRARSNERSDARKRDRLDETTIESVIASFLRASFPCIILSLKRDANERNPNLENRNGRRRRLNSHARDDDAGDYVLRDDADGDGDEYERIVDADGNGANVGAAATEDRYAPRREDLDARARASKRGDA